MAYYKNFSEYIQVLECEGLLSRVKMPINKDTEMHPLVQVIRSGEGLERKIKDAVRM